MNNKKSRPLIGIVPDYRKGSKTGYSIRDYYALGHNYVNMVNKAGGAAILLTYDYDLIDFYLESLDGILVVGGYFDIHPKRYGVKEIHPTINLNDTRENFEHELGKKLFKTNLPFFGICNGMQLLNVIHGGNTIAHIPEHENLMQHEQSRIKGFEDYHTPYHDVEIAKNTKLFSIANQSKITTNSSHHQACKTAGEGLIINAKASDGVIEGLEKPDHPFCLAVQWHPEFDASAIDSKLFEAFIQAAQNHKK